MIQRRVFPLVAFAVAVAAMFGLRLPVAAEVVVLAVSVLLLGIPHGALDVLHARDAQQLQRPAQWARFLLRYVAIALLVVAVWTIAPSASLVGLLVISALHFSGDLERGSPLALRAVHGAVPVCLPALLHRDELGELFAALAPVDAARRGAVGRRAPAGPARPARPRTRTTARRRAPAGGASGESDQSWRARSGWGSAAH